MESLVTGEADQFKDLAPTQFVEARLFAEITLAEDNRLPAPLPGFTEVRHLVFDATDTDGRRGRTEFLLTSGRGYRLKLRVTDYEDLAAPGTATTAFDDFVRHTEWPYECRNTRAPNPRGASVETTLATTPRALAAVIESVLEAEGHELKSRAGLWTSVPVFEWPDGSETEAWHGEFSPGYQLMVMIEQRGDSTAYAVRAPTVCDIGEAGFVDGQPVATRLQTLVTGAVATKISEAVERSR